MEIRQIEAFTAVHASGSVTAAARLLDRSQPVVSRQLQDLEQELGFTLFARTRPQVTLTDQGRQFLDEARHVLASLHQLESRHGKSPLGGPAPCALPPPSRWVQHCYPPSLLTWKRTAQAQITNYISR